MESKKRHSQNGQIKGSQVKRQKQVLPEEVKVLECFPWIRGLKLAGVEHEQTNKVQPSHAGWVTRLMADCTWEQKGSHSHSSSDPCNPEPTEMECTGLEVRISVTHSLLNSHCGLTTVLHTDSRGKCLISEWPARWPLQEITMYLTIMAHILTHSLTYAWLFTHLSHPGRRVERWLAGASKVFKAKSLVGTTFMTLGMALSVHKASAWHSLSHPRERQGVINKYSNTNIKVQVATMLQNPWWLSFHSHCDQWEGVLCHTTASQGLNTHGAEHSALRTLKAASVQTAPGPRGQHGSAVAPCGRERQWQPQTAQSGTALGSRGRAAGSLWSGTRLEETR